MQQQVAFNRLADSLQANKKAPRKALFCIRA
jgi:hypothetical protein